MTTQKEIRVNKLTGKYICPHCDKEYQKLSRIKKEHVIIKLLERLK